MTRASGPTAVIMAKAASPRKSSTGGNYPQWMRTLEEKYQKLHKKIAENTGIGYHRFNHQIGRSVYDNRLSHAVQKYREISATKQNVSPNSGLRKGDKHMSDCATNTVPTNLSAQKQISKQTIPNKLTASDIVNRKSPNKEVNKTIESSQGVALSPGNGDDCDLDTQDHVTSSIGDSDSDLEVIKADNIRVPSGVETNRRDAEDNESIENSACDRNRDVTLHSGYNRRNVKTSLSRTSKVTTKSCPAKIQSRNIVHSKPTLLLRSKSAHKNMYIQMSEEAKHAITETIHEMNLTEKRKPERKSDIRFVPSRTRTTIKTWVAPRKGRPETTYDSKRVLEGASKSLQQLSDEVTNQKDADNESCRSFAGSSTNNVGDALLPEIPKDASKEANIKNNSLRLPGIGKYDIQEAGANFEITPPGFDSRYNDVLPVEDRESETPPPDIRQRAIDKCSEWLTKYNK